MGPQPFWFQAFLLAGLGCCRHRLVRQLEMMSSHTALRMMMFACVAVAVLGQSIRGAAETVTALVGADELATKKDGMMPIYALGSLVCVPVLAYVLLKAAKANGWWGAFS